MTITASRNVRKLTSPPGRPPLYACTSALGLPLELYRSQVAELVTMAEGLVLPDGGSLVAHWRTVLASIDAIEGR